MKYVAIIFLCISIPCISMSGELFQVKNYREMTKDRWKKELMMSHIAGIGVGFEFANAQLTASGQSTLYCPPENLPLRTENYMDILDEEIKQRENIAEYDYIGMALLEGLKKTFPCK